MITGGISAATILSNPTAVKEAAGAAAAVAATGIVLAVAYGIYSIHEGKKKKIQRQMATCNRAHKDHLEVIRVPGTEEVISIEPPFREMDIKDQGKQIQSLHMTLEQVEKLRDTPAPLPVDNFLEPYLHEIRNAIIKTAEFYEERVRRDETLEKDVMSGQLCYIMYILQHHCLQFQGTDAAIVVTKKIENFISQIKSKKLDSIPSDPENKLTEHYSRLSVVCGHLLEAQKILVVHREKMTIRDMLRELEHKCQVNNEQLIKLFAKLVTPNEYWDKIKYVTMKELSDGILSRKYLWWHIVGKININYPKAELSDSIYSNWVKQLAQFYLRVLQGEAALTQETIINYDSVFQPPNMAHYRQLRDSKQHADHEKARQMMKDLDGVRELYKHCQSYLTQKPVFEDGDIQFVRIKEDNEVAESCEKFDALATLIYANIFSQSFCKLLTKWLDELGTFLVTRNEKFRQIFAVFDELQKRIRKDCKKNMDYIANAMRTGTQSYIEGSVPQRVNELLDTVSKSSEMYVRLIEDYRHGMRNPINAVAGMDKIDHEIFKVMRLLTTALAISEADCGIHPDLPPHVHPEPRPVVVPSVQVSTVVDIRQVNLTKLTEYQQQIQGMTSNDTLRAALCELIRHVIKLATKTASSAKQQERAHHVLSFTLEVCQKTVDFLRLTPEAQEKRLFEFCREIQTILTAERHRIVDDHARSISHYWGRLFPFAGGQTHTRQLCDQFYAACEDAQSALMFRLPLDAF
jgi:hypothetical protein